MCEMCMRRLVDNMLVASPGAFRPITGNSTFEVFLLSKVAWIWLILASVVCISFVAKDNPMMHCFKICGRGNNPWIADNARETWIINVTNSIPKTKKKHNLVFFYAKCVVKLIIVSWGIPLISESVISFFPIFIEYLDFPTAVLFFFLEAEKSLPSLVPHDNTAFPNYWLSC